MEAKPEFEPIVRERLAKLHQLWDELEFTTQEKARLLFDANRSELFDQSLADVKKWLGELQQQLQSGDEEVKDLTSANILLKKHQVCGASRRFSFPRLKFRCVEVFQKLIILSPSAPDDGEPGA